MATTPKVLTYEEWLKLPEAEGIEEVVNGEIRKMPPNKWNHAQTVEQLARQLRAKADADNILGRHYCVWPGHSTAAIDNPCADIAVFVRARLWNRTATFTPRRS